MRTESQERMEQSEEAEDEAEFLTIMDCKGRSFKMLHRAASFIQHHKGTAGQRIQVSVKMAEMWNEHCVPYIAANKLDLSSDSEAGQ